MGRRTRLQDKPTKPAPRPVAEVKPDKALDPQTVIIRNNIVAP